MLKLCTSWRLKTEVGEPCFFTQYTKSRPPHPTADQPAGSDWGVPEDGWSADRLHEVIQSAAEKQDLSVQQPASTEDSEKLETANVMKQKNKLQAAVKE